MRFSEASFARLLVGSTVVMMTAPLVNNIRHCLQFVLEQVRLFDEKGPRATEWKPILVGVNGCQGAGKTTLVRSIPVSMESTSPVRLVIH